MSSLTPNVSPLRQRMIDDMRMRKFNGKTQIHYIRAVRRLAAFLKRSPDTATAEDLRAFQLHMVDTGTSPPTINSTVSDKPRGRKPRRTGRCRLALWRLQAHGGAVKVRSIGAQPLSGEANAVIGV